MPGGRPGRRTLKTERAVVNYNTHAFKVSRLGARYEQGAEMSHESEIKSKSVNLGEIGRERRKYDRPAHNPQTRFRPGKVRNYSISQGASGGAV
jgi:hypothetical protein